MFLYVFLLFAEGALASPGTSPFGSPEKNALKSQSLFSPGKKWHTSSVVCFADQSREHLSFVPVWIFSPSCLDNHLLSEATLACKREQGYLLLQAPPIQNTHVPSQEKPLSILTCIIFVCTWWKGSTRQGIIPSTEGLSTTSSGGQILSSDWHKPAFETVRPRKVDLYLSSLKWKEKYTKLGTEFLVFGEYSHVMRMLDRWGREKQSSSKLQRERDHLLQHL